MRTSKRHGRFVLHVSTVSETFGDVVPGSCAKGNARTLLGTSAGPLAVDSERLRELQGVLLQFVAQCEAKVVWNAIAAATSCGIGITVGLAARSLLGGWLFGGVDIPVLMSPAGVFFQVARKAEENARHFQTLIKALQDAMDLNSFEATQAADTSGHSLVRLLEACEFHSSHATPRQRVVRTEVLNLLNQIPQGRGSGGCEPPVHNAPQRVEFLGQIEPRRFVVRTDGMDVDLTRTQYRLLLAIAIRRKLFGDLQPRGEDPGSYYRIGGRRDLPNDIEARFHEQCGRQILDEDGRGTKLRRLNCGPEAISIDAERHQVDPEIAGDLEVAGLLRALASSDVTAVATR